MKTKQIRDFLKQALELESALYTNQRLIDEYTLKRDKLKPVKPVYSLPQKPTSIKNTDISVQTMLNKAAIIFWISLFITVFLGFFLLIAMTSPGEGFASGVLIWILSIPVTIVSFCKYKKLVNELEIQQKTAIEKSKKDEQAYNSQKSYLENRHQEELQRYYAEQSRYDDETAENLAKLDEIGICLEISLEKLYSKNIIYKKYQSLIAVATIYEYLDCGRCFELIGPNGAYNLYETEIRANTIIDSLNRILDDLHQIKTAQFTLYQELKNSNDMITNLLYNISDNTKLTAYYSNATAIAASADRYIVGMGW